MTRDEAPDPFLTPEAYALWCEMNACPTCGGLGELEYEDDDVRECGTCNGSGLDPAAIESYEEPEWEPDFEDDEP
jgi:hypothetical protein